MRRNTGRARPWDCDPRGLGGLRICVDMPSDKCFSGFPSGGTHGARASPTRNLRDAILLFLSNALEQCLKSHRRRWTVDGLQREARPGAALADVFELVKRAVEAVLGR